jgi:hypothetical protein
MSGYIYCFSNKSMPGLLKVGMTERIPKIRLNEANNSDTWKPPTPYEIVVAKKVSNPKQKEATLHKLLSQYTERINPRREFFRVSPEEINTFFDLIDGEIWINKSEDEEDEEDEEEEEEEEEEENVENEKDMVKKKSSRSRDMSKCFTNGQRIRHTIGINKTWIGIYDALKDEIICNTKSYTSLSRFAMTHYITISSNRCSANGWAECECEVNGKWISTLEIREKIKYQ